MGELTPPRPLAAADDRNGFDCGRESLNLWFRRNAWRNQQSGASRTSVVCDPSSGAIAGYVSLSASQIARAHLPKPRQRNQPDPLPAILLGQLAVDRQWQGRGLAGSLMQFALRTSVGLSESIGCFAVVSHPLDEGVRDFYTRFGFEPLPFDPDRSMVVRIADLKASGF